MTQHDSSQKGISPVMAGMLGGAAALLAVVLSDEKKRKKIKQFFQDLKDSGEELKTVAQQKVQDMKTELIQTIEEDDHSLPKKSKK